MSIRFAAASDCAAMLAIYAPYIETTITFEQEVPSQQEFAARLETVQQEYPWIVWEEDGKILGYAYAHKFAERISYRPSAELSVYLDRAARGRGIEVIIAGAGGAAHLPGMVASMTPLPVVGVPVKSRALNGLDSLLSIVQMPAGVPVATVAINGAKNAALIAVSILALSDGEVAARLDAFRTRQTADVLKAEL